MEVAKGAVVRSGAGRDKGEFLVIINYNDSYAYVCDGKRRPLERIKKKNLKHLRITNTVVSAESMLTNNIIRKTLRPFREKADNCVSYR